MKKKRKRAATPRSRLKVGAWYSLTLEGGVPLKTVCVIAIEGDCLTLECPDHCLSFAEKMTVESLFIGPMGPYGPFKNFFSPKFLGYGKPRWFWGRIRRWTDCFGTLYTRPKP